MICIWWDWEGVLYWEILDKNKIVDRACYLAQLHRVNKALQQKKTNRRGQVILLQNTRLHTSKIAKEALRDLEWEIFSHPKYSPDIAPTDYHIFYSISSQIKDITFANDEEFNNWLTDFFNTRPEHFWQKGIEIDRWEQVIFNDGEFLID